MEITQEVRELAAKQNAPLEQSIAFEEAEAGMAEMSKRFHDEGGELRFAGIIDRYQI